MKKVYLLALGVMAISLTQAQITKGRVLVGPQLNGGNSRNEQSVGSSSNTVTENSQVGVGLSGGWAVANNQVIGIELGYNHLKQENFTGSNSTSQEKRNGYSAGVFYRRYLPLSNRFFFFGQGTAMFSSATQKNSNSVFPSSETETRGFSLGIKPALAFQVSRHFHLELAMPELATVGYNTIEQTQAGTAAPGTLYQKRRNFTVSTGLNANLLSNLSLGFRFLF